MQTFQELAHFVSKNIYKNLRSNLGKKKLNRSSLVEQKFDKIYVEVTQKSEIIFFSIIVRSTFFVTGLHSSRKHTFSIVLPNNLLLLRVQSIEHRISLKLKHRHSIVYPLSVSLACEIFIQIAAITRTIFRSISVYVKDQVNNGSWERKKEMSIEIRDRKSHISRAESRKSSGTTPRWIFSRAFIGSNRSIVLDLSHSSRAIGQSFVRGRC